MGLNVLASRSTSRSYMCSSWLFVVQSTMVLGRSDRGSAANATMTSLACGRPCAAAKGGAAAPSTMRAGAPAPRTRTRPARSLMSRMDEASLSGSLSDAIPAGRRPLPPRRGAGARLDLSRGPVEAITPPGRRRWTVATHRGDESSHGRAAGPSHCPIGGRTGCSRAVVGARSPPSAGGVAAGAASAAPAARGWLCSPAGVGWRPAHVMPPRGRSSLRALILLAASLLWCGPVAAEILLPAGFTAHVHVTGEGFDSDTARNARGIPATATLAIDPGGVLYVARAGRRYSGGEFEYLWPLYRIPPRGARLTPRTEARFLYGPPPPNVQIGAMRGARELFVSTFDRDRKVGGVFRIADGRAELFAGGTPERGRTPVMVQPEGLGVDASGSVYVADREQGLVMRLNSEGRVVDPRYLTVSRPRLVLPDGQGGLWVGADGDAQAPWQAGPGEIWHVSAQGEPRVIARGPVAQGMSLGPTGRVFIADRHAGQVFALGPDGGRVELARFTDGDAPRGLAFAPTTPGTRAAGTAGNLLVIVIRRSAWPVTEIVRIAGPFEELVSGRR